MAYLEDLTIPLDIAQIVVLLSGEVVANISGLVGVSGQVSIHSGHISIQSGMISIQSGKIGAQISGTVAVSGQVSIQSGHISIQSGKIAAQVSGVVGISGSVGVHSGHISIQSGAVSVSSGEVHVLSGQLISKVSGEVLKVQAPSAVLAGYTVIGAQSGGTALSSGAVVHVIIKSVSRSGDMWTGPPGVESGTGFLLEQFDEVPYDIDNLNKIYVISEVSGVPASWTAEVE